MTNLATVDLEETTSVFVKFFTPCSTLTSKLPTRPIVENSPFTITKNKNELQAPSKIPTEKKKYTPQITVQNMAPTALTPTRSSNLGLAPNSYIYRIISTAPRQDPLTYLQTDQLAVITSEDTLHFLDPETLSDTGAIRNVNGIVTCLERGNDQASNLVATAGRDGIVQFWDKRSKQNAMSVQSRAYTRSIFYFSLHDIYTRLLFKREQPKRKTANTLSLPTKHIIIQNN